jgi:4-amino-4-deoxy-L-arabinose transferase-like glycosyltransferase
MMEQLSERLSERRVQVGFLVAFCLFLYFFNLGRWDLWNPDEPRYGQVAREIVNGGDWVLMHNNGKMYTDKPPLFFWFIAFSSFLWQGFSSFSVRFPSALFGTLTVLLTYFLGRRLYSSRSGFLSGLILATSVEFAYLATRANIDATLTFFTTAALFCLSEWYPWKEQNEKTPAGIRRHSIYGFYISMALATVTKGPVGFILPLLVSLFYLLVSRDWKKMKAMKLLPGMLLFAVLVLAWYLPAVWKGGQVYLNETLFKHTLNRYSEGWSHVRPFYYFFINFPADFLPWFVFLPGAIVYGFSRKEPEKRKAFLFCFVWFTVIFMFFTLSKGKRVLYLLPLYPAAALMVGMFVDDFLSEALGSLSPKWVTLPLKGLMVVFFLSGIALPFVISAKFPSYLLYSFPMALILVIGSFLMFRFSRFKKNEAVILLLAGIIGAGFFYTLGVVFPLVNPYKSARQVCQEVTSRIQPGERLGLYGGFGTGPYNFYTGIVPIEEMERKEDLFRFLWAPKRVFCILKLEDFSRLQSIPDKPVVQVIYKGRVGSNEIVLISNQ